eukprot:gene30090-37250_t
MTELGRQYFDNERDSGDKPAVEPLSVTIDKSVSTSSSKEEVLKEIKDQRIANAKGKSLKKKKVVQTTSDINITPDSETLEEVTEDDQESDPHYWLQLSAANNNPFALCYLGNLHMQRYNAYLDSGGDEGDTTPLITSSNAKKCGSNCQCSGSGGGGCGGNCSCSSSPTSTSSQHALDVYAAIDCYTKAGALGSAEALFNLGSIYFDGVESVPYESTSCSDKKIKEEVKEAAKAAAAAEGECTTDHVHDEHCSHSSHKKKEESIFDVVITKTDSKGRSTDTGDSASSPDTTFVSEEIVTPPEDFPLLIECDHVKSLQYFTQAAALGDTASQFWCGYCHNLGVNGTNRIDPLKAVSHYKAAAAKGHVEAHYYLSTIYRSGLSSGVNVESNTVVVSIDDSLTGSVITIEANAEQFLGDVETYISQDVFKAMEFYQRASDNGHNASTVCLGVIHYNGILPTASNPKSLPADKRKAFELYNIAAESGSKEAWRNLASMYYLGDGVPKSEETAKQIM